MSDADISICVSAVSLLRATPYDHPFRRVRMRYADQIELQYLLGDPCFDAACVDLCASILQAAHPLGEVIM